MSREPRGPGGAPHGVRDPELDQQLVELGFVARASTSDGGTSPCGCGCPRPTAPRTSPTSWRPTRAARSRRLPGVGGREDRRSTTTSPPTRSTPRSARAARFVEAFPGETRRRARRAARAVPAQGADGPPGRACATRCWPPAQRGRTSRRCDRATCPTARTRERCRELRRASGCPHDAGRARLRAGDGARSPGVAAPLPAPRAAGRALPSRGTPACAAACCAPLRHDRPGGGGGMKAARCTPITSRSRSTRSTSRSSPARSTSSCRIGARRAVPHRPPHPGGPVGGDPSPTLPYIPGHENAGWVHEIGSGVTNVEVGDTVIVHPLITCGLCRAAARATTCTARTASSRASGATAASPSSCRRARAPSSSSIRR